MTQDTDFNQQGMQTFFPHDKYLSCVGNYVEK